MPDVPLHSLPEKRKVDSSILSLITVQGQRSLALSSANMASVLDYGIRLLARSGPLVTAGRRTLGHVECTSLAARRSDAPEHDPDRRSVSLPRSRGDGCVRCSRGA
jgi:hypothetical protein